MLVSPPVSSQSPLWAFSWRVYQQPGIAAQLLRWQDDAGIWVNDWLFALWEVHQGSTVRPDFRQQIAAWQNWRTAVIVPWREWRRTCKANSPALYARALAAELALECSDQAYLYCHRAELCEPAPDLDAAETLTLSLQRLSGRSEPDCSEAAVLLLRASGLPDCG